MKDISKDVILDLLPVYVAGEASADTRTLVEAFISTHPELRALAELEGPPLPPLTAAPPEDLETRALNTTRRLLARKHGLLGLSLLLTAVPVGVGWFEDAPINLTGRGLIPVTMVLAGAFAAWGFFLHACRRLQTTGLEAPVSWARRLQWAYMGSLVGLSCYIVVRAWTGGADSIIRAGWVLGVFCSLGGWPFLWIGERLGQVAPAEKIMEKNNRPMGLFDRDRR